MNRKNVLAVVLAACMAFTPLYSASAGEFSSPDNQEENFGDSETEPDGSLEFGDSIQEESSEQQELSEDFNEEFADDNQEETFTDDTNMQAEQEVPVAEASENQIWASAEIYGLNPSVTEISIPSNLHTSYQISVPSAGETPVYKVVSGSGVKISKDGLVTLLTHPVTWVKPDGSETKYEEYEFGEVTISATVGKQVYYIKVTVTDYSVYYAEQRMNNFLEKNISNSMSDYEKVKTIAAWLGKNFNYSAKYSGYVGLMVHGGGDCWANTNAVNYMCRKLGLTAYTRYAANDPGAGSGHRNSIVIIDGERYLVDCGYAGNAPRAYEVSKMDYDYSYTVLKDGTIKVYQYEGLETQISVPDMIDGKKVTVLGKDTFQNCVVAKDIQSVTLPDTLTTIEQNAFYNCASLKSVTIPENVSSIGLAAFITGVEESELTEIKVDPKNPYFSEKNGAVFDKSGTTLKIFPSGWKGEYHISDGTVKIDDYAFYYCVNLSSVTIPASVQTFGEGAFGDCHRLEKVTLNEGLREIGDYAFDNSWKLKSILIPSSVQKIGNQSFYGISDIRIRILGKNTSFGKKVSGSKSLLAGPEGSTAQKYASDNNLSFVKMNTAGEVLLQENWFKLERTDYTYSGRENKPELILTDTAPKLVKSTDYEISYQNNVNAGEASVEIKGLGIFSGTIQKTFMINPENYGFYEAVFAKNNERNLKVYFTGKEIKPEIQIPGKTEGKDYTVAYKNNMETGYGKAIITGTGNYKGSYTLYFHICKKLPMPGKIKDQIYTGYNLTPEIRIPGFEEDVDYYTWYENNIDAGVATVRIAAIGDIEGDYTVSFRIKPARTSLSKINAGKNVIDLRWNKNEQAKGYQIQYSTDKKFASDRKTVVKKQAVTRYKVNGLKSGKIYYVRMRAYTRTGNTVVYSDWSKTCKTRVK